MSNWATVLHGPLIRRGSGATTWTKPYPDDPAGRAVWHAEQAADLLRRASESRWPDRLEPVHTPDMRQFLREAADGQMALAATWATVAEPVTKEQRSPAEP